MDKAGLQQSIQAIVQVFIGISQSFDDNFEKLSNFWALDDGAYLGDGLEGCLVDSFMSIIEDLSQSLDDVRQETQDLLWSTVSHITHSLNSSKFTSPIISQQPIEEHRNNLLNRIITEVLDYLLVGGVCTVSDRLTSVRNAVEYVRNDSFDKRLKSFTFGVRESFV